MNVAAAGNVKMAKAGLHGGLVLAISVVHLQIDALLVRTAVNALVLRGRRAKAGGLRAAGSRGG